MIAAQKSGDDAAEQSALVVVPCVLHSYGHRGGCRKPSLSLRVEEQTREATRTHEGVAYGGDVVLLALPAVLRSLGAASASLSVAAVWARYSSCHEALIRADPDARGWRPSRRAAHCQCPTRAQKCDGGSDRSPVWPNHGTKSPPLSIF